MVKTSSTMMIISCESRNFYIVPNLRRKYFTLHHEGDVSYEFVISVIDHVDKFSCITNLRFLS